MSEYYDGSTLDGGDFSDYESGAVLDGGSFDESDASPLETMRAFVASYPYADTLGDLAIDYTDHIPNCAGLFPSGMVELARERDVLGNVTCVNQFNFALYTVMEKSPNEDISATYNAEWVMDFQRWVQQQSATGLAPVFGDEPRRETLVAQNGAIYSAEDEGWAIYAIQITATFVKNY